MRHEFTVELTCKKCGKDLGRSCLNYHNGEGPLCTPCAQFSGHVGIVERLERWKSLRTVSDQRDHLPKDGPCYSAFGQEGCPCCDAQQQLENDINQMLNDLDAVTSVLVAFGKADWKLDDEAFDSVATPEQVESEIDNHVVTYESVKSLARELASKYHAQ